MIHTLFGFTKIPYGSFGSYGEPFAAILVHKTSYSHSMHNMSISSPNFGTSNRGFLFEIPDFA